MKKLVAVFTCLLIFFAGCSNPAPKTAPPLPKAEDTTHLTAQDNGMGISVSNEVRSMNQMIPSSKKDHGVVSILVKVANDSKADIPVSPEFVTLKTNDGSEYKYAKELTENGPLGKSAFTSRTIPPDYNGGGLLLFELKTGSQVESLTYKDATHNMTIKYPSGSKTSV